MSGSPKAVQYFIFYGFPKDREHSPLHSSKVPAPKFRFTTGAVLLVFFMKSLQEPDQLLSEAIYSLGVGKAQIRDHGHPSKGLQRDIQSP